MPKQTKKMLSSGRLDGTKVTPVVKKAMEAGKSGARKKMCQFFTIKAMKQNTVALGM